MVQRQDDVRLLSQEEVKAWVDLAQQGHQEAVEALCRHFRPLVMRTAGRYRRVSFEEALQEGYAALVDAIQQFDRNLGVPFTGYVAAKVHGDVRTAMRRLWRYEERIERVEPRYGGEGETVHSAEDAMDRAASRGIATSGGTRVVTTMGQTGAGEAAYESVDLRLTLSAVKLSDKEQEALAGMLRGESVKEMAARLGVSVDTVKWRRKQALHKLRAALGGEAKFS